MGKMQGCKSWG